MGEIWGRYTGGIREVYGRYTGDIREMWGTWFATEGAASAKARALAACAKAERTYSYCNFKNYKRF